MTCSECRYGEFESPQETMTAAGESNGFRGLCRRFPPSTLIQEAGGLRIYTQPLVYGSGSCGEFKPKDGGFFVNPDNPTRPF